MLLHFIYPVELCTLCSLRELTQPQLEELATAMSTGSETLCLMLLKLGISRKFETELARVGLLKLGISRNFETELKLF